MRIDHEFLFVTQPSHYNPKSINNNRIVIIQLIVK